MNINVIDSIDEKTSYPDIPHDVKSRLLPGDYFHVGDHTMKVVYREFKGHMMFIYARAIS